MHNTLQMSAFELLNKLSGINLLVFLNGDDLKIESKSPLSNFQEILLTVLFPELSALCLPIPWSFFIISGMINIIMFHFIEAFLTQKKLLHIRGVNV